jgi:hypothetical protein
VPRKHAWCVMRSWHPCIHGGDAAVGDTWLTCTMSCALLEHHFTGLQATRGTHTWWLKGACPAGADVVQHVQSQVRGLQQSESSGAARQREPGCGILRRHRASSCNQGIRGCSCCERASSRSQGRRGGSCCKRALGAERGGTRYMQEAILLASFLGVTDACLRACCVRNAPGACCVI